MNEKIIERAGEIITERAKGSQNFVTLAFVDRDGYPHTTTISISKSEGIKWLTFCTGTGAKKDIIDRCNKASVCINSSEYHIALTGTIEQITDLDVKKEMWYDGLKNHFSGYDDPNYCVLKFTAERYNLLLLSDRQDARGNIT
ncbi:MAG: pyridoxamine 5'-phosphate oxidase family protein [Oscillospiraceae bacterium]|nr:pyridoxamine 5'-phosphate oxidase family protein [Oscillospiraceae bacterium]